MLKKFFLVLCVLAHSVPFVFASTFVDVSSQDWFSVYVNRLGNEGIINTQVQYFYPHRSITRAELAKMAVKAAQQVGVLPALSVSTEKVFCDVAVHDWANEFVSILKTKGVTGVPTSTCTLGKNFLPNQFVTRAEALKILFLVFNLQAEGNSNFHDVDRSSWYSGYINTAARLGIVSGYGDGTFKPNGLLTRAEMSKVVTKMMDIALANSGGGVSPIPVSVPTSIPAPQGSRQIIVTAAQGEQGLRNAINNAQPGDTILLSSGTYRLSRQLWIDKQGTAEQPIIIRAQDSNFSAKITGSGEEGINIGDGAAYITIDGLEIYGMGDNVIHIQNAHHITIQNVRAYGAGPDGDVVKVNQSHHITVANNELSRPGARPGCPGDNCWQEVLDFVDTDDSVIRGNLMTDFGNLAGYVKGGSTNVVIENNTIQNQRSGAGDPAWGIGGWTDRELLRGRQYEASNVIFRNNILKNNSYGALGVYDANNVTITNNQFIDNSGVLIEFRSGNAPLEQSNNVTIEHNVFNNNDSDSLCDLSSHGLTGLVIRDNTGNNTSLLSSVSCSEN